MKLPRSLASGVKDGLTAANPSDSLEWDWMRAESYPPISATRRAKSSPGDDRRIRKMPNTLFAINKKIERDTYQIGNICWRNPDVARGRNRTPVR